MRGHGTLNFTKGATITNYYDLLHCLFVSYLLMIVFFLKKSKHKSNIVVSDNIQNKLIHNELGTYVDITSSLEIDRQLAL